MRIAWKEQTFFSSKKWAKRSKANSQIWRRKGELSAWKWQFLICIANDAKLKVICKRASLLIFFCVWNPEWSRREPAERERGSKEYNGVQKQLGCSLAKKLNNLLVWQSNAVSVTLSCYLTKMLCLVREPLKRLKFERGFAQWVTGAATGVRIRRRV